MAGTTVLLGRNVDFGTAEEIYMRAKKMAEEKDVWNHASHAAMGMRVAVARDHRFMLALEQLTECLNKAEEEQNGRTRRDTGTQFNKRFKPVVVQAYTEAYKGALSGQPVPQFAYLYATVAQYAGCF